MSEEIWKDVEGYENYKVSNFGNVYSKKSNRFLKPVKEKNGYLRVHLSNDGLHKKISVHRLVALHFIRNHTNQLSVDHIDCNKQNNNASNLRWCGCIENAYNRIKAKDKKYTSIYKGVCWVKSRNKWQAQLFFQGKNKRLGLFEHEVEAYEAYKKAAKELHGEFFRE